MRHWKSLFEMCKQKEFGKEIESGKLTHSGPQFPHLHEKALDYRLLSCISDLHGEQSDSARTDHLCSCVYPATPSPAWPGKP